MSERYYVPTYRSDPNDPWGSFVNSVPILTTGFVDVYNAVNNSASAESVIATPQPEPEPIDLFPTQGSSQAILAGGVVAAAVAGFLFFR